MDKSLLSQLRDINGLDAIGIWPLAPGWWVILVLLLAAGAAAWFFAHRTLAPPKPRKPDWNAEKVSLLSAVRGETDSKKKAAALSALLRQAAMMRHGREACAGLEGTAWLDWLSRHDPAQFDWTSKGKILLEAPYAPATMTAAPEIDALVAAAEQWM